MNSAGWIFIFLSWGAIIGLLIFCIMRLLAGDQQKCKKDIEE